MSLSAQAAADIVSGTALIDAEHEHPPGWVDMVLPAGSVQEIQPANLHQPAAEGQHQQGPSALHTSGESLVTHASTFSQLPGCPQFISSTAAPWQRRSHPYQNVGSRQRHASTFSSEQCACLQQSNSSDCKSLHHQTRRHSAVLSGRCNSFSTSAQSAPCRKSFSSPGLLKIHLRGQQVKDLDPPRLALSLAGHSPKIESLAE